MAQKIIITAKQVTPPSSGIAFGSIKFSNSEGTYLNTGIEFTTDNSMFNFNLVKYNFANTDLFAQEIKNYFDFRFNEANVPFQSERIGNVVNYYLGSNATVDTFMWGSFDSIDFDLWSVFREDYTFPLVPPTEDRPTREILSRSPFYFQVSPTIAYDSINADIYIYTGDVTDVPTTPTFTLSKSIIQAGQSTISLELSKILNDYVQNGIIDYPNNNLVGSTSSTNDSVWCYVDAGISFQGAETYRVQQKFIAFDGYGLHEELFNPLFDRKVLSTITTHDIYNGAPYPLYFSTNGLQSIIINGVNVPFSLDTNINNQYVGYVDINSFIGLAENFTAVFNYGAQTVTHNFNVLSECKYNIIYCYFKNKYGFFQQIPFNKVSKKTAEFKSESYNTNITNFGNYNLKDHTKRSYLSNGKESVVCNTDFIKEYYNDLFDELLMSTKIYLRENNVVRPVNIKTKNIAYKTRINDKLIQYTFEFENSYNKINII
jgi:hypothetical protein